MKAERVTQAVSSTRWNARLTSCLSNVLADDILRQRRAIIQTKHSWIVQTMMLA
jgi:hypothetical protein